MGTTGAVVLLLCLTALGGCEGQDLSRLRHHLQQMVAARHPTLESGAREAAREYIREQFREYGLEVTTHAFNTTLTFSTGVKTVVGQNVVGVAGGSGAGPVVVVGADYDTNLNTSPLRNNGAGVAVLLEAARNYMEATSGPDRVFERNRTVVFVAFDLNTNEYADTSAGKSGSYHFVHQWLWPFINQSRLNLAGAIILDSISEFNIEAASQYLPQTFSDTFPVANKRIVEDSRRGNFLALITRSSSQNTRLTQAFVGNYNKHRKAGLVRLQEMVLQTAAPISVNTLSMLNHQAHYHFWTFQTSGDPTALPAILLTDTDVYRRPAEPCLPPCTTETFLTRQRQQALTLIFEGLIHTLLDLQADRRTNDSTDGSGAASPLVTLAATWVMAGLAMAMH